MYTLYQYQLSSEAWEAIKSMSWEDAEEQYPEIASFKTIRQNGFQGFDAGKLDNYVKVAYVSSDSLEKIHDLATVNTIKLMDGDYTNNERTIGVGDILVNERTGRHLMIDPDGYTPLDIPTGTLG